jgi:lambda repressor-like predicted transcriptional regulator
MWECLCECGETAVVNGANLRNGKTRSCCRSCGGSTHGMADTPEYNCWIGFKGRCYNHNTTRFHRYGGRGITVCDRWLESFENFFEDMGPMPFKGASIGRLDNDGPYCPDNCRWETLEQQANNTSKSHYLTHNGETLTVAQWARKLGLNAGTIYVRLARGKSIEAALATAHEVKTITYNGETLSLHEWSRKTGISACALRSRLKAGWPLKQVLATPSTLRRRLLTYNGESMCLAAWSRKTGLKRTTITQRLAYGWSVEQTLTTPVRSPKE